MHLFLWIPFQSLQLLVLNNLKGKLEIDKTNSKNKTARQSIIIKQTEGKDRKGRKK